MISIPYKLLRLLKLDLPVELQSCARHFARASMVPEGTALIVLISSLLSLRSRHLTHEWFTQPARCPNIGILLLGESTSLKRPWLEPIIAVLEANVSKPKFETPYPFPQLEARFNSLLSYVQDPTFQKLARTSLSACEQMEANQKEVRNLHDWFRANRFSKAYHAAYDHGVGFHFSSLVMAADGVFTKEVSVFEKCSRWPRLLGAQATPMGSTTPATTILPTSVEAVRRMRALPFGPDFPWPLLLPSCGPVEPTESNDAEAAGHWTTLVKAASDSWSNPPRHLKISGHGYESLSKVKEQAEAVAEHRCHPSRFQWVMPLCANIAIWDHLNRGEGEVIGASSWDMAVELTRWAIQANGVASRQCGQPNFHPPKEADDLARLRAAFGKNPEISYRSLVRAMPKREPRYWRKHWELMRKMLEAPAKAAAAEDKFQKSVTRFL